jgi:hypothetical protein
MTHMCGEDFEGLLRTLTVIRVILKVHNCSLKKMKKEPVLICDLAPQFLLRNQTTIYKTACSFTRTAGSLRFVKCPKPMVLLFQLFQKTRANGSLILKY